MAGIINNKMVLRPEYSCRMVVGMRSITACHRRCRAAAAI
uniref:Uncharacterized protein n=2 Tax=Gammaproteobacteria TaxID=1236 RepID=A0A514C8S7_MORMO|nr:hypothetical protein [Morganella morganii]QDX15434.1 hypothetical protein [Actinobacillus pleuropneumoniae]